MAVQKSALVALLPWQRPSTVEILGLQIHKVTIDDVLSCAASSVTQGIFSWCVTVHVDMLLKLLHDNEFHEVCKRADLVVADGMPLLWTAQLLGNPLPEKVSGSDVFERLVEQCARLGHRLFLLGGQDNDAEKAARVLELRHPSLRVVGVYSPPFGFEKREEDNRVIQAMVLNSGADILVVGLGAPKQEKWIARWARGTAVSFAIGVGISFSFVAGTVRRAPYWMQRSGFEWLWRLSQEPKRLWRRYLIDDLPFLALVARQWFRQIRRGSGYE